MNLFFRMKRRRVDDNAHDLREGDLAWYFKSNKSSERWPNIEEAKQTGGITTYFLVRIQKLHFDDYPNLYYTITMLPDDQVVAYGRKAHLWFFEDEKQTDRMHLIPYSSC